MPAVHRFEPPMNSLRGPLQTVSFVAPEDLFTDTLKFRELSSQLPFTSFLNMV